MARQKEKYPDLLIPKVCEEMLTNLSIRGTQEEGIFRIGGRIGEIENIRQQIDDGIEVNLEEANIHDVSGLFKKFLRELPTPLLTFEVFNTIVADECKVFYYFSLIYLIFLFIFMKKLFLLMMIIFLI